jgi:hypothetical protein
MAVGFILFILGLLIIALTSENFLEKLKNEYCQKVYEAFRDHKRRQDFNFGGRILIFIGLMLIITSADDSEQKAKKNLRQAVVSFFKERYPEVKVDWEPDGVSIKIPSKTSSPSSTFLSSSMIVGDITGTISKSDFTVYCYDSPSLFTNKRLLGNDKCLSSEDREGRSIIDAFYHIYNIRKPSEEEFIKYIRRECIKSSNIRKPGPIPTIGEGSNECEEDMSVITYDNKKYKIHINSEDVSSKDKRIWYVSVKLSKKQVCN